jgi:hypothetical protein
MDALTDGLEGSSVDRFKQLMTKAKESGLQVTKLFNYFTDSKESMTKQEFMNGISRLGNIEMNEDEVDEIVAKFDIDHDGTISMAEFKVYCYYEIPSVAWKAERKRVEASGEMDKLKSIIAGHAHHSDDEDEVTGRQTIEEEDESIMYGAGEMVFKTTKLFWRTNTTVDVYLFYQEHFDIITVQVFNQGEDKEMPCLFVHKSDLAIDSTAMEEAITNATMTSDVREAGQKEAIMKKITWEFYSNYLLARLKLPDSSNPFPMNEMRNKLPQLTPRTEACMPFFTKLSGDSDKELMIAQPPNLENPPAIPKAVVISEDDFMNTFKEFQERKHASTMGRMNAEKMQNLMSLSLNAFNNAEHDAAMRRAMNAQQRMWLSIFTKWVVRKQVAAVRSVLDKSPAYAKLVEEQQEKKAGSGGAALPPI